MSDYSEFFLNSKASIVELQCIEISHSLFSQTYYVVRNATLGVTVTHEDASSHDYVYYPLKLSFSGPREDLDQILSIQFGDLGEIIPEELGRIRAGNGFAEYPVVKYRTYRSDILDAPLYGPIYLQVKRFNNERNGSMFEAKAPSLNVSKTGEKYSIARFPMLSGLL